MPTVADAPHGQQFFPIVEFELDFLVRGGPKPKSYGAILTQLGAKWHAVDTRLLPNGRRIRRNGAT
jgi:hypothetical protein